MIYFIILIAKFIEVTLATLRMVFIAKGQRNLGVFISVFEILIWVILTGTVVTGIIEDPMKIVAYTLGFAAGCYFGSLLEEKIALGYSSLNIIVNNDIYDEVIDILKAQEVGYTVLDSHGEVDDNKYIIAYVARRKKSKVLATFKRANKNIFITVNDSTSVIGGHSLKRK